MEQAFLHGLVQGRVDDVVSMEALRFRVPRFNSRSKIMFDLPHVRTGLFSYFGYFDHLVNILRRAKAHKLNTRQAGDVGMPKYRLSRTMKKFPIIEWPSIGSNEQLRRNVPRQLYSLNELQDGLLWPPRWKCDVCATETGLVVSKTAGWSRSFLASLMEALQIMGKKLGAKITGVGINNTIGVTQATLNNMVTENERRKKKKTMKCARRDDRPHQRVRDIEQYSRKDNVETVGVHLTRGEDIYSVLERP
ncbi:hypothetical protein J6590_035079 [Homalodisca vitripennis]|nr:hypothetical protein J6590_035079 [Homalodisca vitripennis]